MTVLSFPVAPPKNGDDLDATIAAQLFNYLLEALQALDLSNAIPGSLPDTAFPADSSPLQRFIDGFQSFVAGGGLSSGFTTLTYTVPAILGATFASNGIRVASITGQTFTAAINSDTYVSCRSTGVINTPQAVANGASAPALPTADSQWLQKVTSNGTTITSIVDLRSLSPLLVGALPGGYAQITGTVNLTAPVAATLVTGLTVTVVIPPGARRLKITAYAGSFGGNNANSTVTLSLWDGVVGSGTEVATFLNVSGTVGADQHGASMQAVVPAVSGFKTYNVGIAASAGDANVAAAASAPAFILVEAI